jgi:diphthine synthase
VKEIIFIGLGLNDGNGISLQGLEETKSAHSVFIELYTSVLPHFSKRHLEALTHKSITELKRADIEEKNAEKLITAARKGKTILLVPGDPLIATTHTAIRLEAHKNRIRTRIIHAASIISAAIGLSGLHNYKFGKTVTIPFPDNPSRTPYITIAQNKMLGLHTLCLLDIRAEQKQHLTINTALTILLDHERKQKQNTITPETLAIGIARVGSKKPIVKAGTVTKLLNHDFGNPPHALIFPGKLHFIETEALIAFADAPETIKEEDE